MNPRERWSLLLIDELPDRPPVWPLVTSFSASVAGIDIERYCRDPEALATSQIKAQQLFGHEALAVFTHVGVIAEAFGSNYIYQAGGLPELNKPVLESAANGRSLRVPDPAVDGVLPAYIEAMRLLYEQAGDRLPVFGFIPCPFTTAAGLRGINDLLTDLLLDPELIHKILGLATEGAIKLADAAMRAGALPVLVDPLASGSVISPEAFRTFALPYTKRIIDHLHRYDLDVTLHICGDTSRMLDAIIETGADLFSFDKIEPEQIIHKTGNYIRLVGNIPPHCLLESSKIDIGEATDKLARSGILSPKGFVISTGCEVPLHCSPEKLHTMINRGKQALYPQRSA